MHAQNNAIGNRIKEVRKQSGLTLKALSIMTGLSISYLSLLERDMNSPSVEHLNKVCTALGISLADLTSDSSPLESIVVKAGRRRVMFQGRGFRYEAACNRKGDLSCIIMSVYDEIVHYSEPHISDEIGFVINGEIMLNVSGTDYHLKSGDSIYIRAGSKHHYRKTGGSICEVLFFSTTISQTKDIRKKRGAPSEN